MFGIGARLGGYQGVEVGAIGGQALLCRLCRNGQANGKNASLCERPIVEFASCIDRVCLRAPGRNRVVLGLLQKQEAIRRFGMMVDQGARARG